MAETPLITHAQALQEIQDKERILGSDQRRLVERRAGRDRIQDSMLAREELTRDLRTESDLRRAQQQSEFQRRLNAEGFDSGYIEDRQLADLPRGSLVDVIA